MSAMVLRAVDETLGIPRCEIPDERPRTDVGRSSDCTIVLPSKSVSRVHARFQRSGSELLLEDLGSSNGTTVNGQRIQQPIAVHTGDRIRFGSLEFVLEEAGPADEEAATLLAPAKRGESGTSASKTTRELGGSPTPAAPAPPSPPREPTSKTAARDPVAPAAAPSVAGPASAVELALIATGAYVAVVVAGLLIRWALGG